MMGYVVRQARTLVYGTMSAVVGCCGRTFKTAALLLFRQPEQARQVLFIDIYNIDDNAAAIIC